MSPTPDFTYHDLHPDAGQIKNHYDLSVSARELAKGCYEIIVNEDLGLFMAWENLTKEEDDRIIRLVAGYLEKEILERW